MNKLSNTFHFDRSFDTLMDRSKKDAMMGMQPESLYSMALYDVDAIALNQPQQLQQLQRQQSQQPTTPAFYPVDEYKDMSLREILDISDDFLFGSDNDPLMEDAFPAGETSQAPMPPVVSSSSVQTPFVAQSQPELETIQAVPSVVSSSSSIESSKSQQESQRQQNNKKRSREECSAGDDDSDEDDDRRFRPYQAGQWSDKFVELCEYRERLGHCLVPHTYDENLPLARWVKRQRYQYKLMQEHKASTMTEERVVALEEIGFVWDSQRAAWEERLTELKDFRRVFQHSNVPSNFSENPQLATWVKCQRRQYKLHCQGKPSNMIPQRINQLEALGFEWELRTYKK